MTDYRHSLRRRPGGYEWAVSGPLNVEVARGFARTRDLALQAVDAAITTHIFNQAERERAEHAAKYGPMTWLDEPEQRSAK
jgi:hypothetical protein